jgi:hypothetical protein
MGNKIIESNEDGGRGLVIIHLVVVCKDGINGLNMFQPNRTEFEPGYRLRSKLKF